MTVKYTPVAHDSGHTMEQQMFLLADAAWKAWKSWCDMRDDKFGAGGVSEVSNEAMRNIYSQCYQTDVFMGGVHHGEKQ